MKKILALCIAVLMTATTVKAQHEIGAVLGGLNGASYKYWLNDALALQADLAVGLTRAYVGAYYQGTKIAEGSAGQYDFTINPNVLYHWQLPENFKLYAGGGLNLGLEGGLSNSDPNGKFGINAAVGATYDFDEVPLVFALDFRPGYGLGFRDANTAHLSFFDWKLGFAIRYKL
jgi:hypothetical protein